MKKTLKLLKLWPFHDLVMGRIDPLDFWSEFAMADIYFRKFTMAMAIQTMEAVEAEIMAEKSAQLDYIR